MRIFQQRSAQSARLEEPSANGRGRSPAGPTCVRETASDKGGVSDAACRVLRACVPP